jgi:Cu(I)/Ag(I) efflux system membrane fusion protein
MSNNIVKTIKLAFAVTLMFTMLSLAQNTQDSTAKSKTMNMHKMEMMKDSTHQMMDNEKMSDEDSIVRSGVIDLEAIDKNKDGKVFQDMMDFNVISDIPGKCPLCGMKLKEVTLEKAKKTLLENDFKVKGK